MKYTILFILFIHIFACCKNKESYSIDEIVQTDSSGKTIGGNLSSNDWKLVDFNSSILFNDVQSSLTAYYMRTKGDTLKINKNCKLDSFKVQFYPNPMTRNQQSFARIYCSEKIKDISYGYRNKLNNGITTYEIGISAFNFINNNTVVIDISYPQFNNGQDVEIYFCVIDSNNCGYYFSGKVKVQ
jgi:hypothetical protein